MLNRLQQAYKAFKSNSGEYEVEYWYHFDDVVEVETFTPKPLKDRLKEAYLIFIKK